MKTLLTAAMIFFVEACLCQVSGKLAGPNGQPLALANVRLLNAADTSVVKSAVTNDKGAFVFNGIPQGNYVLSCSSIGYKTFQSPAFEITTLHSSKDFGLLVILENANQLNNVVVRVEKPLYQQQPEGMTVNVENSVMTKGSTALEVLERSPGVTIDHHNNSIALNGKNGVMVMLNGKLLRMPPDQLITLLNGMNADDIATIELLTTSGAKYDAEGSAGTINIVLKKNRRRGDNGSISATGGYGYREKASVNAQFSHNTAKTDVYGSYSFSHTRGYQFLYGNGSEVVPELGGATDFIYRGLYKPTENSHNVRAGIDARLTPGLTVGGSVGYNSNVSPSVSINRATYNVLPDSLLTFNGYITGRGRWNNVTASAYAEKQLGAGEKINMDADYLYYNTTATSNVQSTFVDKHGGAANAGGDSLFSPMQKGYGNAIIQVGVLKMDYTKQLNKNLKLEAGLKGTYTKSTSGSGIESLVNGVWANPGETINDMVMREGIAAVYASLNTQINQSASLITGLRYEYYNTRADSSQTDKVALLRRLGQLFPSVFFTKKINDNSSIQVSYTKRITRPSYRDLASYVAYNDPLSVFTGNPLLKSTITNNLKFGYNYRSYSASLLFSRDDYPIAQGQVTSSPSGYIVYISPQNVTYQDNITLQTTIPVKVNSWWGMNYGFVGGWRQFRLDYTLQPVTKSYWAYSLNTTQTFKLPRDWSIELSGQYNSVTYYGSGKTEPIGMMDAGIKKVMKNNRGTLQLSVTDVLRSTNYITYLGAVTKEVFDTKAYISWYAESTQFPIIRLTYSRSFGGGNKAERKHDSGAAEEKDRAK